MMQTKKEVGPDRFKFMLEFPNKVRVYVSDEQILSKILERSGISSEVKTPLAITSQSVSVGKDELFQARELQRQDHGGFDPVSNYDIKRSECIASDSQKSIDDFQKTNANHLPGYKIDEDKDSYTIVRKSRRGYTYSHRINRWTVEKVYLFLKNIGKRLPVSDIERELNVSNMLIYNALRVLQSCGKVDCQPTTEAGKHRFMYKAI